MLLVYVIEMFCDRVAASKTYQGKNYTDRHPLEYFERGRARRTGRIHPKTSDLLEELLTRLAEQGEDKTFAHIRTLVDAVVSEQLEMYLEEHPSAARAILEKAITANRAKVMRMDWR